MAKTRSVFSQAELDYLHGQRLLGRIATVGADGTPHVAPVGWAHNADLDTIDVTGHGLEQTKKFRDVARTGRAAIVIDDLASTSPWRPRAIEVRGRAEALRTPEALIRIHPERIISWGHGPGPSARTVTSGTPLASPCRAVPGGPARSSALRSAGRSRPDQGGRESLTG